MSDLTPCNWCTLRWMRAEAKRTGARITTAPAKDGGTDVFRNGQWIAWFMELTDRCAC